MSTAAPFYLLSFAPNVLVVGGLAVGLTLAFVRRAQLGSKAFMLAVVGMALMIIVEIAGPVWTFGALRAIIDELGIRRFNMLLTVYATISQVLFLTGLGLLIGAIFAGRPRGQSPPPS